MNDQQIRKLVLSMDEDMRLGKDMVEQVSHYCKDVAALKYFCVQLLKYVPMKSEVEVTDLSHEDGELSETASTSLISAA